MSDFFTKHVSPGPRKHRFELGPFDRRRPLRLWIGCAKRRSRPVVRGR